MPIALQDYSAYKNKLWNQKQQAYNTNVIKNKGKSETKDIAWASNKGWEKTQLIPRKKHMYIFEKLKGKKKKKKPVKVFQLTAICESSDSVSSQHSTCKKHSLCGGLHQLLYNANVFCSALVYHAYSSNIHT